MVSLKFPTILLLNILIGLSDYGTASLLLRDTTSTEESQISNQVSSNYCRLVNTTLFVGNINWTRLTGKTIVAVINRNSFFNLRHCSGDCRLHDERRGLTIKDNYALQMRNLVQSCNNKTCDYLSPCCVPRRYHKNLKMPFDSKDVTVLYYGAELKKQKLKFTFPQPRDCHCQ